MPDSGAPKRAIVIGGGVSGLAAAHHFVELQREKGLPVDLTLLEAGPRLGGVTQTAHRDGFLLEAGPDSFITDKPWAVELASRLALDAQLIGTNPNYRRSYVVRRGRLHPVPEGFYLLAPSELWPMVATPIFSPLGKLRMGLDLLTPRKKGEEDESLAAFVRRRLGREALERLAQPMIAGIHAADPESLSLEAVLPRFAEMEREHGSIIRALWRARKKRAFAGSVSGPRYGLFATFRDGMQTLSDALAARLPAGAVRLSTPVTGLTRRGNGWSVALRSGEALPADAVILATGAPIAAKLLHPVDFRLGDLLSEIPHATAVTLNFAFSDVDVPYPLDGFGFVVPAIENRPLIGCTYSSVKFAGRAPDRHVLLRVFLGGVTCAEAMQLDDEALVALIEEQLRRLLGIIAPPLFSTVHRHENSMPAYTVGHAERVYQIDDRVARLSGLRLAGSYFKGVGTPDCVKSGEEAAAVTFLHLSTPARPATRPIPASV